MRFEIVFILFSLSLVTLAMTHYVAMSLYLYWMYPLFDVPMHFLGGVVIALGSQTMLFKKMVLFDITHLLSCLALVLLVGIAWEVFEWHYVITDMTGYVWDTSIDIVMDLLGGVFGFLLASRLRRDFV